MSLWRGIVYETLSLSCFVVSHQLFLSEVVFSSIKPALLAKPLMTACFFLGEKGNYKKNNFNSLFYGWGLTFSRLQSHCEETVYFYHIVPRSSWYSFYWPWKGERLSWPWSHPVVLNLGTLPRLWNQHLNH